MSDFDHRPANGHDYDRARPDLMKTDFAAWEQSTLARFAKEATEHMHEQDQRIAQLEADIKLLLKELREMIARQN